MNLYQEFIFYSHLSSHIIWQLLSCGITNVNSPVSIFEMLCFFFDSKVFCFTLFIISSILFPVLYFVFFLFISSSFFFNFSLSFYRCFQINQVLLKREKNFPLLSFKGCNFHEDRQKSSHWMDRSMRKPSNLDYLSSRGKIHLFLDIGRSVLRLRIIYFKNCTSIL